MTVLVEMTPELDALVQREDELAERRANILTFAEAGGLARSGFNAAGIAITANYLESDRDYRTIGVPPATPHTTAAVAVTRVSQREDRSSASLPSLRRPLPPPVATSSRRFVTSAVAPSISTLPSELQPRNVNPSSR